MRKYLEYRRFKEFKMLPNSFDTWLFRRYGCRKGTHWLIWMGCKKFRDHTTAYWKCQIPGCEYETGGFPLISEVEAEKSE